MYHKSVLKHKIHKQKSYDILYAIFDSNIVSVCEFVVSISKFQMNN